MLECDQNFKWNDIISFLGVSRAEISGAVVEQGKEHDETVKSVFPGRERQQDAHEFLVHCFQGKKVVGKKLEFVSWPHVERKRAEKISCDCGHVVPSEDPVSILSLAVPEDQGDIVEL